MKAFANSINNAYVIKNLFPSNFNTIRLAFLCFGSEDSEDSSHPFGLMKPIRNRQVVA